MIIQEVKSEHAKQYQRHTEEYTAYLLRCKTLNKRTSDFPFAGFEVDYNDLREKCLAAIEDEFGFTKVQARYIYSMAYSKHAVMSEVYEYVGELCLLIKNFPA